MRENNFHCQPKRLRKQFRDIYMVILGFPGGSDGGETASNAGDQDSIPRFGRSPGGGHGNPLQYSCLENPHGQRSLVGCRPWGCKESDKTEWLSTAHVLILGFKYKAYLWLSVITSKDLRSSNKSVTRTTATPNSHFYSYYMLSILY